MAADVGSWTWGTVQGAFNEKASLSQILVDAVIGMIPLVGDVTAARDIIAVVIRLIDDPEARERVWEWVLLVVLVLALVPVIGGVIKGVGRILCKVFKAAAELRGAARAAHLLQGAKDIIAFLNRIGTRNAEAWLLRLKFADYQAQILERFAALTNTLASVLRKANARLGALMPEMLAQRIKELIGGLGTLRTTAEQMIPKAIKELDQNLRELQAYVRSGGETTSRVALHRVATGERVITRADEARLVEDGVLPVRSSRGGFKQNPALVNRPKEWEHLYKHEDGYPNLADPARAERDSHQALQAYSGKMINRQLRDGEHFFRAFGEEGVTHDLKIRDSFAGGAWWGIGEAPKSAQEWRPSTAVLDEFNRNGFIVTGKVVGENGPKAVVGTVAEQAGKKLPGQYLPGGATQAFFLLDKTVSDQLTALGKRVISENRPLAWVDPVSGMRFEIKPTGWEDVNGIIGYFHTPGPTSVTTVRLAEREQATKEHRQVVVSP
ncbi:hypothetical protein [Xanthomonas translucens]|uniref:hypothetical protein n=1 Tax=Xanthomonas campestris pv. translucens TaxID=343 RepID=UPI0021B76D77|nr:hypothetical protein [Xanthomonas translucens]MCT8276503.1 hypothetical protein [Xanthomonas translucens pv. translucens]WNJ27196.1 hypothetical protein RMA73_00545 [Xanthomonas translucens pv. translucens]